VDPRAIIHAAIEIGDRIGFISPSTSATNWLCPIPTDWSPRTLKFCLRLRAPGTIHLTEA